MVPYGPIRPQWVNPLAPWKFEWNFRHEIFKQILVNGGWGISCDIVLKRMSLDFTDDRSTLFQVMAWCRNATSHYLSQCWPRSMSPNGVIRPQWVKDPCSTFCILCNIFKVCLHCIRPYPGKKFSLSRRTLLFNVIVSNATLKFSSWLGFSILY